MLKMLRSIPLLSIYAYAIAIGALVKIDIRLFKHLSVD